MADLVRGLAADQPVFYVSTSPWNLYHRLAATLAHHGLPTGPLLLNDWGFSRKQFFAGDALKYKVATIGELLDDFPGRPAVLVGDSGQHDLDAYLRIAERHPGRIRAVLIREVPGLLPRDHGPARARAEELGVPLCIGTPEALRETARDCGVLTDS